MEYSSFQSINSLLANKFRFHVVLSDLSGLLQSLIQPSNLVQFGPRFVFLDFGQGIFNNGWQQAFQQTLFIVGTLYLTYHPPDEQLLLLSVFSETTFGVLWWWKPPFCYALHLCPSSARLSPSAYQTPNSPWNLVPQSASNPTSECWKIHGCLHELLMPHYLKNPHHWHCFA